MWLVSHDSKQVKNEAKVLKYENGNEAHPTLVSGDICPDLNVKMPEELGGGVWFSELITAGNCPECEKPNANGEPTGALGRHSEKCLNSLWQAPLHYPILKLNVQQLIMIEMVVQVIMNQLGMLQCHTIDYRLK